ncbi:hypothetical protein LPJ64_005108 [Coemansia asiatica]|uniref:Uncharacterized protein n=1 Tax=Coemansia asiatica TaxID=1052880 RepID=A0A9W8CHY2_9FUNG|nr:hypothetical protein LPJ64_005108 [Coemansia asiatica]
MSIVSSLFTKAKADINEILDPSKVPGSSVYTASNGTDLGMQAIFAASFFVIIILLFSALRLRWPFIFSPRTRLTITAPPFLSKRFFGWVLATIRTPETHILNTLGLDSVIFLRFYKMCTRLLLDVAFFSIVIIWPLNIRWSKANLNPQTNGNNQAAGIDSDGDLGITLTYSVTDYLFNLTLNTADPKQKWYLVPHIVFVYVFSGLAYYHISKFSSRWASLRWHFLMQSRHARVSRTIMLTDVPKHLAGSPRELEWFCGPGLQLGNVEQVRVCPFNTRLTSSARERARCLVRLEHAYKKLLGNPCVHPEYDPEELRKLAMDSSQDARLAERMLLDQWAKPSKRRNARKGCDKDGSAQSATAANGTNTSRSAFSAATPGTAVNANAAEAEANKESCVEKHEKAASEHGFGSESGNSTSVQSNASAGTEEDLSTVSRPTVWVRSEPYRFWRPWQQVDAIDYWRSRFLAADQDFQQLRDSMRAATGTTPESNNSSSDNNTSGSNSGNRNSNIGYSTTAFVTFEDAATAHMFTQLSFYPNPGFMKAKLAPEPRGVYWPNIWISSRRKWLGFTLKWLCIFVIWAFWTVPVILFSSLLTPASLAKVFPSLLESKNSLLRSFLSSTVPSVFLLLFLNMLPWILKQVHFITGARTKPDIDYSVMTKMWAFLVFNVILVFGISGTFWDQILNVVNDPGTVMQNLASNIPRVGTFFTGYILVLGVAYQPFKLLQLRPVIWHIGRQWLCNTPRDYARLVSPVYIDWYSVYPYPLLVFAIAMIYSTFSPPVVLGAVIYFVIGYPVMKYLLLYVYFHPFETAGMAWPKVCRRMIFSIILYQIVILTFVVVKGGGWYTFSMVPIIMLYLWFFYHVGWSLEKQGTVLPMYLWRNPPPNSSYPLPPPEQMGPGGFGADALEKPSIMALSQIATPDGYADGPGRPWSRHTQPPEQQQQRQQKHHNRLQPGRSASFLLPGQLLRASENRVVKRMRTHHRRESSRGVRTREIILAGRLSSRGNHNNSGISTKPDAVVMKRSYTNVGSARNKNTRDRRDGPWLDGHDGSWSTELQSNAGQRQFGRSAMHTIASNSPFRDSRSDSWQKHLNMRSSKHSHYGAKSRRRKRYKSLAEAATVEGSRLIMSLGRLPNELSSWRDKSKRNSMSQIEDTSLPKISPLATRPLARSNNGSASRRRPWSFAGDKLQLLRLKGTLSNKDSADNQIIGDNGKGSADSGLAIPPVAHSKTALSLVSASNNYNSKQKPAENIDDDDGNSNEWIDDEDLEATGALAVSASYPGQRHLTEAHGENDWDPLVYLKPSVSDSYAQGHSSRGRFDGTLGTLLADLDSKPSISSGNSNISSSISSSRSSSRSSGFYGKGKEKVCSRTDAPNQAALNHSILRQRHRQRSTEGLQQVEHPTYGSESSVGHKSSVGEAVAASIIDAERSPEYDAPPAIDSVGGTASQEPSRAYGLGRHLRGTLQRMRDYFLADFRPAGPILDLTYDRMYSQGLEDPSNRLLTNENGELVQDNGDRMPPLRHILERVLPRSVSRSFGHSQDTASQLLPTATVPPVRSPNTMDMVSPYLTNAMTHRSPPARACGPSLAQILADSNNSAGMQGSNHQRSSSVQPMMSRLTSKSPPQANDSENLWHGDLHHQLTNDGLPRPPRAPWLDSPSGHLRSASQPAHMQKQPQGYLSGLRNPVSIDQTLSKPSSSYSFSSGASHSGTPGLAAAPTGSARASHKNSLPPQRPPLPARVVSELNYVSRHSALPSLRDSPFVSSHQAAQEEDEEDQLMTANYQRFAVEAQSTFEPDEFTDYSQTPMLNFPGILDRGIRDYVHPGLVGELPTLWLPVRAAQVTTGGLQGDSALWASDHVDEQQGEREQTPVDAMRILALSAPGRALGRMFRQIASKAAGRRKCDGFVSNDVGSEEPVFYASGPSGAERKEQQCLNRRSIVDEAYAEADLTPLTPIIEEEATPRSPMMAENRNSRSEE